jgi:quercetin dioxygenase-like cupin family protein
MKASIASSLISALFGALLCAASVPASAQDAGPANVPRVKVTPLSTSRTTAIGQPITLPQNAEVRVLLYEIPAGMRLPVHKHPYPRYAYVLAGTLRVADAENVKTFEYKAGDFIIEMIDTWHYGMNIGDDTVRLLVIDQVDGDKNNTIPFQ